MTFRAWHSDIPSITMALYHVSAMIASISHRILHSEVGCESVGKKLRGKEVEGEAIDIG